MRGRSDTEPAPLMISGLRQSNGEAARRAVPAHATEGLSSRHYAWTAGAPGDDVGLRVKGLAMRSGAALASRLRRRLVVP